MKKTIKTWWLETHDNIDVCGDGKCHYTVEHLPDYAAVEYREGEHPDHDMETLGEEISKLLGIKCHWVRGQDIYRWSE